jgi:hypothetical protein
MIAFGAEELISSADTAPMAEEIRIDRFLEVMKKF